VDGDDAVTALSSVLPRGLRSGGELPTSPLLAKDARNGAPNVPNH
jgi:hypothetical protein